MKAQRTRRLMANAEFTLRRAARRQSARRPGRSCYCSLARSTALAIAA